MYGSGLTEPLDVLIGGRARKCSRCRRDGNDSKSQRGGELHFFVDGQIEWNVEKEDLLRKSGLGRVTSISLTSHEGCLDGWEAAWRHRNMRSVRRFYIHTNKERVPNEIRLAASMSEIECGSHV